MVSKFEGSKKEWEPLFKDGLIKVQKNGFDLYIPNTNSDEYGCFLVDSICGHDCVAYDSKSVHSYYILEGNGTFEVDGKKINAEAGVKVSIDPNMVFYYSGTMKMVEEIVPNFDEKHFHVVEQVTYDESKKKK